MISRRGSRPPTLLIFIVLGIAVGIVFMANQRMTPDVPAETALTDEPMPDAQAAAQSNTQPIAVATGVLSRFPQPTWQAPQVQLYIPKAQVVAPVIQVFTDGQGSWDIAYLGHNVGHLQGTAWIYHPGNIALVGHVEHHDGSLGVFASLRDLAYGDEIVLQVNSERRIYSIDSVNLTSPDDVSVLYPTDTDRLTLITCSGYDFVSSTYANRLVAVAVRIS